MPAGTGGPPSDRHALRRLAGSGLALLSALGALSTTSCGSSGKKECGIPIEALHPGTSTRSSLHLDKDGQIRAIVTDNAWYQAVSTPPGLDPSDGTLTVTPDGRTVTFTDSRHHTVRFAEHPGRPYCPL